MSKLTPFKKFNTANGFCYLLDNYVVITDHSDPKEILRRKASDNITLIRIVSALILISLASFAYFSFQQGNLQNIYILSPSIVFIFIYFLRLRNRSMLNIIERSKIQGIELKRYMFSPAFYIHFKNNKGQLVTRIVVMKSNNRQDIQTAIGMLTQHRLLKKSNVKIELNSNTTKTQTQQKTAEVNIPDEYNKTQPQETYKRNSDGYLKDY